ncbi:hypothetical protein TNCV_3852401 [Trichonephila clavipes]|nr:hypothetical protein TNCV_3852401 [Trichonephila clavipes]
MGTFGHTLVEGMSLSKLSHQEKNGTHQFLPILERCHPLESFNYKCPIRRKTGEHINSLQFLNDVIHCSPSTIRELGYPVTPKGDEQVADACCMRKNRLPGKPY